MFDVTQEQIGQRWDSLPDEIRELVFSDVAADFIDKTCQEEHLPKEKISDVSRVTGYVLYGFIHPEDLPKELANELQIDSRVATAIAQKINDRIFTPLGSLIDNLYAPISPLGTAPVVPQIIEAVDPAKADAPKIISTGVPVSAPVASPIPRPTPTPAPAPVVPKPNLAAAGWSKLTSAAVTPAPMPATPALKAILSAPSKVTVLKPATEPAPVIIHEDAIFNAQSAKPDFHIAIHPEELEMRKGTNAIPLKPAVLELGKKVPAPAPTKVVHYDEFKEKLLANIPVPTGRGVPQRNISEITAMPKPPVPPAPVASTPQIPLPLKAPIAPKISAPAPKPPSPPIAPTKMAEEIKVVQKDYL